jgi:hypothetical protein
LSVFLCARSGVKFFRDFFRALGTRLSVRIHSASRVRQNPTPRTIEQSFHFHSLSAGSPV